MKIYIGADHNGLQYKTELIKLLERSGHEVLDQGDDHSDPDDDYPQFAGRVAAGMLGDGKEVRGILICGSGQGMAIAANRFKGIRAALCWNTAEARAARNDDDANVLCLASRYTSLEESQAIVSAFMSTAFAGAPRFVRRIKQLDELT